jgi:DNA polymerase-3 subunit epsilon
MNNEDQYNTGGAPQQGACYRAVPKATSLDRAIGQLATVDPELKDPGQQVSAWDEMHAPDRLDLVSFAVFDVETTGLHPNYGHRVCEIACIRLHDATEVGRFETLVDPGRDISPGAFRINQITAELLAGAPSFKSAASPLLDLMQGAVLVAHNAAFDLGFLAAELDLAGLPSPDGPVVDTLTLVRRVYAFRRNSLSAVADALAVETGPAHRAMGDVWTTCQVLQRLLSDLERRFGVTTLRELLAFQGGSIPYPQPEMIPLPPTIAEAIESRRRVWLHYVDAHGRVTKRSIRPLRVREHKGHLHLVAHCYRAEALRTFRLDRVVEMALES